MKNLFDRLKSQAGMFKDYRDYQDWCDKKYPYLKKKEQADLSGIKQ